MIRIRLEEERKVAAGSGTNEGKESREGGVVVFKAMSNGAPWRVSPPGFKLRVAEAVGEGRGKWECGMVTCSKLHENRFCGVSVVLVRGWGATRVAISIAT